MFTQFLYLKQHAAQSSEQLRHYLTCLAILIFLLFTKTTNAQDILRNDTRENVVVKAILLRDHCQHDYPSLSQKINDGFVIFQKANKEHFDAVQSDPEFNKKLSAFKKYYSDLAVTENECQKLIEMFSSEFKF